MIKVLSVALLNGRKIQIYLHLWRLGIEVSVTQRLGVFKPITWYGDSRTTDSIPSLYRILTVLQTRNIDHLNFNSNGLSLCASVLFSNFLGAMPSPGPLIPTVLHGRSLGEATLKRDWRVCLRLDLLLALAHRQINFCLCSVCTAHWSIFPRSCPVQAASTFAEKEPCKQKTMLLYSGRFEYLLGQ